VTEIESAKNDVIHAMIALSLPVIWGIIVIVVKLEQLKKALAGTKEK
jgi:hypothetical protein